MQDVKIIDIDNVQWNMKDQEARNKIVEVDTILKKQKTIIDGLVQSNYINKRVDFKINRENPVWIKINNLYSKEFFENNVFAFMSRNGEYHQVMCGITDENIPVVPLWVRFFEGTNKISNMRFKDGVIWALLAGWSILRVQQIAGTPIEIVLTEEVPPADAVHITMKQIQMS